MNTNARLLLGGLVLLAGLCLFLLGLKAIHSLDRMLNQRAAVISAAGR